MPHGCRDRGRPELGARDHMSVRVWRWVAGRLDAAVTRASGGFSAHAHPGTLGRQTALARSTISGEGCGGSLLVRCERRGACHFLRTPIKSTHATCRAACASVRVTSLDRTLAILPVIPSDPSLESRGSSVASPDLRGSVRPRDTRRPACGESGAREPRPARPRCRDDWTATCVFAKISNHYIIHAAPAARTARQSARQSRSTARRCALTASPHVS